MSAKAVKPKLIIFDLDYTLWPFWVDTHVTPPFSKDKSGNIVDARGDKVKYYPEVPNVLETLQKDGYEMGIASRTGEIDGAYQLLDLFDWNKYFKYKEIYPGCKVTHFSRFQKQSGIALEDMLFFDDEDRNIRDLEQKGVASVLVERGVTMKVVQEGLKMFADRRK